MLVPDPVDVLTRCGGAARWAVLRRHGVARGTLVARVATGDVCRPAAGLFALPICDARALAAAAVGGVLSCASSLADHGVPLLRADTGIHLTTARGTRRDWGGCVVHRRDRPHDGGRVDLAASLADAAACLPLVEAVAAADALLASGRVDVDAVPPGARWSRVLALTDPVSQSVLESAARVELVLAGLGPVRAQVWVDGVGHVDLLVQEWLVVETDGFAFHSSRSSYREDRRRDDELVRRGYAVLRFTWEDVVQRPAWLVGVVRDVLDRGRPPFWRCGHAAG